MDAMRDEGGRFDEPSGESSYQATMPETGPLCVGPIKYFPNSTLLKET
jgi:hypothetical protein